MTPDQAHVRLLAAAPELGPSFGMDVVLGNFADWLYAQHAAGRDELVQRAFAYVEWLQLHADADTAAAALEQLFRGADWGTVTPGPATRAALGARGLA